MLRPVWLDEKTGRRDQKDGPLADILRSGGVILFNLTDCSADQLSSYQSLFDQEAQLLGRPVPKPQVQVIGLEEKTSLNTMSLLPAVSNIIRPWTG